MNNLDIKRPLKDSVGVIYYHGEYKIATVLDIQKNNLQVAIYPEDSSQNISLKYYIYSIDHQNLQQFVTKLEELITQIDVNLLWELVENTAQKIDIDTLSQLYFGDNVSILEKTALLFAIDRQRVDFHSYGSCQFSKRDPDERQKWQVIQAKKRAEEEQYQKLYQQVLNLYSCMVGNNDLPVDRACFQYDELSANINVNQLLIKPNKHSILYKVFNTISHEYKLSILQLTYKLGLIADLPQFFLDLFLSDTYGLMDTADEYQTKEDYIKAMPQLIQDQLCDIITNPEIFAFSIDDSSTTEIDDAFSVREVENGYIIGVHIAAPALDPSLANIAGDKISTVYHPGGKITMLPQGVIDYYSLVQGSIVPVVSIYFTVDREYNVTSFHSVLEKITISCNLHIENLAPLFTLDNLDKNIGYQYENELKILYRVADNLAKQRGKPSTNNLVCEYNFVVGREKVTLVPRERGNAIDKVVSEFMILANCSWGRTLTNSFIPAIYRVKQPRMAVKMTTKAESHTGLNVDYYTWATSPLRRASDYMNQYQIISLIRNNKKHYLTTSIEFARVVERFDAKYAKYIEFQNKMERYYALKYLMQENISEIAATFVYGYNVQLDGVPIIVNLEKSTPLKAKGETIQLKVYDISLIELTFELTVLA